MDGNKNKKVNFVWNWLKMCLICIAFFLLMFLQIFQARKVSNIKEKINDSKKDIVNVSLELAEIEIEIEKIKNSDIIDDIAINKLGMIKINKEKYKIIEYNYGKENN